METALAPWFALADTLLPRWHHSFCGIDDANRQRETLPPMLVSLRTDPDGQEAARRQQLRETLTVFAFAYELHVPAFAAAVCAFKQLSVADCGLLDENNQRLRVKIQAAVGLKKHGEAVAQQTAFFDEWSTPTASKELQRSVDLLTSSHKRRRSVASSPRFDLEIHLELLNGESVHSRAFKLVKMVQSINCTVFNITDVTLNIHDVEYADIVWEELFQLLHSLRRDAVIHIQAKLPHQCGIGFWPLVQWKRRFDLITKTPKELIEDAKKKWNVALMYQHPEYDTSAAARAIISSLSALAHSTVGISSLSISDVLQGNSQYAKWLGYFLQAKAVETLQWTENALTMQDVDAIESIYLAPTHAERLQRLWFTTWRDERLSQIASVRQSVADETQFIGVMHDDARDHCVEVHLAGFGQCRVDRRLAAPAIQKLEHSVSGGEPKVVGTLLKSLTLKLKRRGNGDGEPAVRLINLIGSSLEELVVDAQFQQLQLTSLVLILDACPRLRRMSIKSLRLSAQDDTTIQFTSTPTKVYQLESLSVGVAVDDAASGLLGFVRRMQRQLPVLKEFRLCELHPRPGAVINQANAEAIARMFCSSLVSITSLRVTGLHMAYFQDLLTERTHGGHRPIETLEFDSVAFTDCTWQMLMAALSSSSHLLTRSVHTLKLRVDDPDNQKSRDVMQMLEKNHFLVDVQAVFTGGERASIASVTSGVGVHRRKAPLLIRHKLALLSVVKRMELSHSSDVLPGIFVFAAPAKTRSVRLSRCP